MKIGKSVIGKCFFLMVLVIACVFGFSPANPGKVSAAMPGTSCPDATLSFSQENYNVNDTIRLNGSNPSGTWTLCIYRPDGQRMVSTMLSTNSSTSVSASLEGQWTGVIVLGETCSMNLSLAGDCRAVTQVGTPATPPAGGGGGGTVGSIEFVNPIETDDFTDLVQNVLRWILSIAGGIALFMLIYGGVIYITSTGDPQRAEQGKRIVVWTIVGLIVILLSYSIIMVVEDIFAS